MSDTRGFTLLELMICMAILACCYLFSHNSLSTFYERNQLQRITRDIRDAISYAKAQTQIQGKPILLMAINRDDNWSSGMVIVADDSSLHGAEKPISLREWHWSHINTQIFWQGFQSRRYLVFKPELSQSAVNGRFLIRGANATRILIINRLGRLRVDHA